MKSFRLDWDTDYGSEHRRGFSISIDGHYVAQLTWLPIAIWKAIKFLLRKGKI